MFKACTFLTVIVAANAPGARAFVNVPLRQGFATSVVKYDGTCAHTLMHGMSVRCLRRDQLVHTRSAPLLFVSAGENDADVAVTYGGLAVREWRVGDEAAIRNLLTTDSFDPEGPISTDCATVEALRTAYDSDDNCCFLVATAAGAIVGTAALATGTQVTTVASGASVSTPDTAGALRRVAVSADLGDETERVVIDALLSKVERRATEVGCSRLLALGYASPSTNGASSKRPSNALLAQRGYVQGDAISGTLATQFVKLLPALSSAASTTTGMATEGTSGVSARVAESEANRAARLLVGRGSGIIIVVALLLTLVGAVGVANLLGLDLSFANDDNRGMGMDEEREDGEDRGA